MSKELVNEYLDKGFEIVKTRIRFSLKEDTDDMKETVKRLNSIFEQMNEEEQMFVDEQIILLQCRNGKDIL